MAFAVSLDQRSKAKIMETPDLCRYGGTVCPVTPPCAEMNTFFARTLFICCFILLSVIFLGHSGLSFDCEDRRKGRDEILKTLDLCRYGGTVCLVTSPCAQMNRIFARILFMLFDLTLCPFYLGTLAYPSTVRVGEKAESRFWKHPICSVMAAQYVSLRPRARK